MIRNCRPAMRPIAPKTPKLRRKQTAHCDPFGPLLGCEMRSIVGAFSAIPTCIISAALLLPLCGTGRAETASVYGGSDGLCGHRTANGERLNCTGLTAAHRTLPFGTRVVVCHSGCVTVRINDRGPWVRGRNIDLSPAAARAIGLHTTGHVSMSVGGLGHNVRRPILAVAR
jgi:rare lipoprotein A